MLSVRLLIVAIVFFIFATMIKSCAQRPLIDEPLNAQQTWQKKEEKYVFYVPENGNVMRFEVSGNTVMNTWSSIEFSVFDENEQYLFTVTEELWKESGRDSDGYWEESQRVETFDIPFPKAGEYIAYVSDTSHGNNKSTYYYRIYPLQGDGAKLSWYIWLCGAIAVICFIYLIYLHDQEKLRLRNPYNRKKPTSFTLLIVIFSVPLLISTVFAMTLDDDDIDYLRYSYSSHYLSVDRSLKEQSITSSGFRTGGSGRGGK